MKLSSKVQTLTDLIAPAVTACDVELWGIEFKPQGNSSILRVYIDLPASRKNPELSEKDNSVSVEDCKRVSHQISGVLDVHDPIAGEFTLEVSSPGWDRQFFTPKQLHEYIGSTVALRLITVVDSRRKITGKLVSINDTVLSIDTPAMKKGEERKVLDIMIGNIDKVSLVYEN